MNNKDYKAIAEMFRLTKPSYPKLRESREEEGIWIWRQLVNKLADYFEKEDTENQPTKDVWNRKQFLKEAGAEK